MQEVITTRCLYWRGGLLVLASLAMCLDRRRPWRFERCYQQGIPCAG
jgi:hypothetical protein